MASTPGSQHAHAHAHGPSTGSDTRSDTRSGTGSGTGSGRSHLLAALALLTAFMLGEVVTAVFSGSLALLSDAGHMLSDVGAIGGSLWAIALAARPPAGKWTFGWKRAEILSAAANGITLLVVAGIITVEAVSRLIRPPAVDGGPVIAVAAAGIVVNVAAAWVLARANRNSLNVRGAFRHVLTDLYGFIGTVVAGIVIVTTGFTRADAIASLIVVGLMVKASWELLRDSGRILLEAAPEGLDMEQVRAHLGGVPHVLGVHDLHAWTVTSGLPALSAHVVVEDSCFSDGHAPGCWISSRPAWPGTSTSSTPPSSWKRPRTPATKPALTSHSQAAWPGAWVLFHGGAWKRTHNDPGPAGPPVTGECAEEWGRGMGRS